MGEIAKTIHTQKKEPPKKGGDYILVAIGTKRKRESLNPNELTSFQGFWCFPMTTVGLFLHKKRMGESAAKFRNICSSIARLSHGSWFSVKITRTLRLELVFVWLRNKAIVLRIFPDRRVKRCRMEKSWFVGKSFGLQKKAQKSTKVASIFAEEEEERELSANDIIKREQEARMKNWARKVGLNRLLKKNFLACVYLFNLIY